MSNSIQERAFALLKADALIEDKPEEALVLYKNYDYLPGKERLLKMALEARAKGDLFLEPEQVEEIAIALDDKQALERIVDWYVDSHYTNLLEQKRFAKRFERAYYLSSTYEIGRDHFTPQAFSSVLNGIFEWFQGSVELHEKPPLYNSAFIVADISKKGSLRKQVLDFLLQEISISWEYIWKELDRTVMSKLVSWPEIQEANYERIKECLIKKLLKAPLDQEKRELLEQLLPGRELADYLVQSSAIQIELVITDEAVLLELALEQYRRYGTPSDLFKLAKKCVALREDKAKEIFEEAYDLTIFQLMEEQGLFGETG